jgi:alpha-mannosidase
MIKIIHFIGNAHLDPVLLWNRREDLNEGIAIVRIMLVLRDEFLEMSCIYGESALSCNHK